jgi:hypothetical protein
MVALRLLDIIAGGIILCLKKALSQPVLYIVQHHCLAPSCNSGLPNGIWHFENHANKLSLR